MPSPADTLIDVHSLVDRPGATTSLERHVAVPPDFADELIGVGPRVTVAAVIERVVDGLLVRGTVTAPARVTCARCLAERDEQIHANVVEVFSASVGVEDDVEPGYEIIDATIDLDTLIRDALAAVMPVQPLCRPDCNGLCPVCGADLNVAPCSGHAEQHDPRWAALSELRLPDAR